MKGINASTLTMIAVMFLSPAACGAVLALTGSGELAAVAWLVVLGVGVDQVSRLTMREGRR